MSDLETHKRVYRLEQALAGIQNPRYHDPEEYGSIQARADAVAALHGDRAPPPILGESPLAYRRRLLGKLQGFSPRFAKSRFDVCDAPTIAAIEEQVYSDASQAASQRDTPGELRPVKSRDEAGRLITRFYGDVEGFIGPFVHHGQRVRINR